MSLVLAVEPDRRRAAQLKAMALAHLDAEFILAPSVAQGFQALGDRVPDILLTAPLLPPSEDAALDDYLRLIGPHAAHIQSLTIPLLSTATPTSTVPAAADRRRVPGFLRERPATPESDGCEPARFAEQIAHYLMEVRNRTRVVPPPSPAGFDDAPETVEEILDLTPLLDDAEPDDVPVPEPIVELEMLAPEILALPAFPVEEEATLPALTPIVEPEPAVIPTRKVTPEPLLLPAMLDAPPAPAALTPQQLAPLPAVGPLPVAAPPVLPAAVQHVIEVPTGNGAQVQAAVSVNVAVSVQVAAAVNVSTPPKKGKPKPIQDEWGIFDPTQCGFEALLARLDEIAAKEEDNDA